MLLVKDSMVREVATLSPGDSAGEALGLCRERRIRHLPVVENGRLVGVVSPANKDLLAVRPLL